MANILLPSGKIEFVQSATAGCRDKTVIAGKEVSIKKTNAGLEGNCVDFGTLFVHYEFGNLSPERVKEVLVNIAKEGFLDLSEVPMIAKVKDIPDDSEYLYCIKKVPDAFDKYMTPPYEIEGCDDDDGIFEVDEDDEEE